MIGRLDDKYCHVVVGRRVMQILTPTTGQDEPDYVECVEINN